MTINCSKKLKLERVQEKEKVKTEIKKLKL